MATRKFNRDSRQLRVADALNRLVGSGPAAFFRDACRLMAEPSLFEAMSHQVGHLIREIESSLRAVLKTVAPAASASTSAHDRIVPRSPRPCEGPSAQTNGVGPCVSGSVPRTGCEHAPRRCVYKFATVSARLASGRDAWVQGYATDDWLYRE
jgi:hypothetical protein